MPKLNWAQALDPDFVYSFGDPRPVAVLSEIPRGAPWYRFTRAAVAWVKDHPEAVGYIEIPYGDGGAHFFTVGDRKPRRVGAIHVHPKFFKWHLAK